MLCTVGLERDLGSEEDSNAVLFFRLPEKGDSSDRIRTLIIVAYRTCTPSSHIVVGHCALLIILRIICPAT